MKALNYGLNLNNAEVAELIRTTRKELYTANPSNRRQYTIRGAAKAIGISPTYYEKLENNKNAVVILKPIYAICKHLRIPINVIVQLSLNLSDEETRKHFLIRNDEQFSHDNGVVFKNAREQLKVTQEDVAKVIGCSKSHFAYCEEGKKSFKDIRPLYKISNTLNIPMYVLIRNELGITNEEMAKVISFENGDNNVTTESTINDLNGIEKTLDDGYIKLFEEICRLSKDDLRVLVFMKIVFHSNQKDSPYNVKGLKQSFNLGKELFKYFDEPPKMSLVNEMLQYLI